MCEIVGGHRSLLSKLQLCCRLKRLCGLDFTLAVMYGCVPLPPGEGGAERRVRVWECVNPGPHPGRFLRLRPIGLALRGATFSQTEKDTPSSFSRIWTTVVIDRP